MKLIAMIEIYMHQCIYMYKNVHVPNNNNVPKAHELGTTPLEGLAGCSEAEHVLGTQLPACSRPGMQGYGNAHLNIWALEIVIKPVPV